MLSPTQQLEKEIETKQLLLKAMKADEKERNKPHFAETRIGKAYLGTMKVFTRPFANMYSNATDALENPFLFEATKLEHRGEALVEQAVETQEPNLKLANKIAKCLIDMDALMSKHEIFELGTKEIDAQLRDHMKRLRPPKDVKKLEQLESLIDQALPQNA